MKLLIVSFLLVASIFSFADPELTGAMNCVAKAPINARWEVSMSFDSRNLEIRTNTGSIYKGTANYMYSAANKYHTFYLPLKFDQSIAIRVDTTRGVREIAMCLAATECYLCKE